MKLKQFVYLGTIGAIYLLSTQPVKAQEKEQLTQVSNSQTVEPPQTNLLLQTIVKDTINQEITQDKRPNTDILHLNEIRLPHTNIRNWLAQENQQNQIIELTKVRLAPTTSGLEVILETPTSDQLKTTTKSEGNTFSATISNAQLRLPSGDTFRSDNPTSGITTVTVTNLDANSVLLTVTGKASLPTVELFDDDTGLIFGFTTTASATESETPPIEPSAEGKQTIELTVTGEQEGSYQAPTASTATKLELPQRDIPQSIQVVPRQVIEDRRAVRFNELTDNVSGVRPISGYGGISSAGFYIRGFSQGNENFRNGFRDFGFLSPRSLANVERVEFLKGPGSVLYGGGAFGVGGVVNTVTKKPLLEPRYEADLTIGSYNFYRPTIDLTGPLTSDRSLLYRLNVAYQNADSFRDFNENEIIFVAPALTWQIGNRTKLTVEAEYQRDQFVSDFGFPYQPESLRLPVNRFLGIPGFNNGTVDGTTITYNIEHSFSDDWRFRQGLNATLAKGDFQTVFFGSLRDDRRTLDLYPSKSHEEQENYTLQNELFGKFNTGALRHNFLIGLELARYRFSFDFAEASVDPIDIFNPSYNAIVGEFIPRSARKYGSDNIGIYFQDLIEILPNLKILAGGRFDFNDSSRSNLRTNTTDNQQSNSYFSPRAGIVYQPSQTTSLYVSWSNSFNPQFFSRSRTDEQFQPETAEQFEVGIKQELFNNRLSANLAFYQLSRQNVLTSDPIDPRFSIQTGEQRSRGIELDIAGEISPGWKIIATYAYTDASVTEDEVIPVGNQLVDAPRNSASVWTTYQIQQGNLQGLGFGTGLYYVGERQAQLPNTIELPSFFRTDAAIFYRQNNFRAAVNFKNLFSVKTYETGGNGLVPGAPLTVLGTVSFQF